MVSWGQKPAHSDKAAAEMEGQDKRAKVKEGYRKGMGGVLPRRNTNRQSQQPGLPTAGPRTSCSLQEPAWRGPF